MKKSSLIAITLVSLLLIGGSLAAWILFLRTQEKTIANPNDASFLADFPGSGAHSGGGGIFGSSIGESTSAGQGGQTTTPTIAKPILLKIYNEPTAGLAPYDTEEQATRVRFVDKATGDILEYTYETKTTGRVVRETIPRVMHAVFSSDARTVYRQYLDDAGTLITVETPLVSTGAGIRSTPLTNGTTVVIPTADQKTLSLVRSTNGIDLIENTSDEPKTLWSSALTGWQTAYAGNVALVYQNPSYDIPGTIYRVNTDTGIIDVPFNSVRGLIAVPNPTDRTILFSRSGGAVTSLFVFDPATHAQRALPVRTVASKCVWSTLREHTVYCAIPRTLPERGMPDTWYRGEVSLQDDWYTIDTDTGERTLLYDAREASTSIDVTYPVLNSKENALFFINKSDETLWMLGIPPQAEPQPNTTTNEQTP